MQKDGSYGAEFILVNYVGAFKKTLCVIFIFTIILGIEGKITVVSLASSCHFLNQWFKILPRFYVPAH